MFRRPGTWVWCNRGGRWCRGQVIGFDRTTKSYAILFEDKTREKIPTSKLRRYKNGRYKPGQIVKFINRGTLVSREGKVRYPTSPSCDMYYIAPNHDPSNLIEVREVDIQPM